MEPSANLKIAQDCAARAHMSWEHAHLIKGIAHRTDDRELYDRAAAAATASMGAAIAFERLRDLLLARESRGCEGCKQHLASPRHVLRFWCADERALRLDRENPADRVARQG